jgi:hypothetical protein
MPKLRDRRGEDVAQYIAHNPAQFFYPPTEPRTPFGQHFLVGGNVQVLDMLREMFPEESEVLLASRDRTKENLSNAISITPSGRISGDVLELDVQVVNRTGHKLPTGFPSRRIWLHVKVSDQEGRLLFESGRWDSASGEIAGLAATEPHRNEITDASETMIYEATLEDLGGQQTQSLLLAAKYGKDNRILPAGFDPDTVNVEGIDANLLRPVGTDGDEDFLPGSDTVNYRVRVPLDAGAIRVEVEALYQSIKPADTSEMIAERSEEERRFLGLLEKHNAPAVMASREIIIGGPGE